MIISLFGCGSQLILAYNLYLNREGHWEQAPFYNDALVTVNTRTNKHQKVLGCSAVWIRIIICSKKTCKITRKFVKKCVINKLNTVLFSPHCQWLPQNFLIIVNCIKKPFLVMKGSLWKGVNVVTHAIQFIYTLFSYLGHYFLLKEMLPSSFTITFFVVLYHKRVYLQLEWSVEWSEMHFSQQLVSGGSTVRQNKTQTLIIIYIQTVTLCVTSRCILLKKL